MINTVKITKHNTGQKKYIKISSVTYTQSYILQMVIVNSNTMLNCWRNCRCYFTHGYRYNPL